MSGKLASKILRTTLALVYFQVNVAWGAATSPSAVASVGDSILSVARHALSVFRPVSKAPNVFVFREEFIDPAKPPELPKVKPGEKPAADPPRRDQEDFEVKGKPIKDAGDLKGPAGDFVKDDIIKPGADVKNLKLSDLNLDNLQVGGDVRALLVKARDAGDPQVKVWTDGGTPILTIAGLGSIRVDHDPKFGRFTDAKIDNKLAGTVKAFNAANEKAADVKEVKPADVAKPEAKPAAKPADPVRTPVNNPAGLRGLGFNGRTTPKDVANIQGNGAWVVTTDPNTGKQTRKFEGTSTWETSAGLKYTATATPDGKVQLTREATGTFKGNNVAVDGKVTEVDFAGGKAVAKTTMPVGTTETRVNGELTHFDATNGPILREVLAPAGRGKAGGDGPPPALAGAKGEYVVREGAMDSVFKMVGGKVELQGIKDAKTGVEVVSRQVDGKMVGNLGGEAVTFKVLGGPRFDAATGQAQLNINVVAAAGEKRVLEPGGGRPGALGGDGGAAGGHQVDGVTFRALGNGKMEVTANKDGALMAATVGLGGGKVRLVQTSNITNSVFTNKAGVEVGRTLDGVKILDKDGKPAARPPLVAMSSTNAADLKAFGDMGIVHTAPFAIPAGATDIKGTLSLPGEGARLKANIDMKMPNGAAVNLNIADGKHVMTINTTAVAGGADTKLDLGAADIEVDAGKNVKVDLDTIFSGAKTKQPDGVSITEKIIVGRVNVTDVRQVGVNLDAKVTSSDVKAWINPLTGNLQLTHNGKLEIEGKDFKGTIELKNGRASDLTFRAKTAYGATIALNGPAGKTEITVPDTGTYTMDLNTGAFKPRPFETLPQVMDGIKIKTPQGIELSFAADTKASGGVAVTVGGNFNVFGANVAPGDVKGAKLVDGKVTLDLKDTAVINLNQPITVAEGKPNGVVNNAQISRIEVNMFGGVTGIGTTNVAKDQKIFVAGPGGAASGAGGGAAAAGGAGPNLAGITTKNVDIKNVDGGQLVTGKAGGQVAIVVQQGADGKVSGQINLNTNTFENVTVDAAGTKALVGGMEITGKVELNKIDDKNFSFKALTPGSVVDNKNSGVKFTLNEGSTVAYQDGKLKNATALDGVKMEVGGAKVTFVAVSKLTPAEAAAAPGAPKKGVVARVDSLDTTFLGAKVTFKDLQGWDAKKPVFATLESGQLKFTPPGKMVFRIYENGGTFDAKGVKIDKATMMAETFNIDTLSGRKSVDGTIDLKPKEVIFGPSSAEGGDGAVKPVPKGGAKSTPVDEDSRPARVPGSKDIIVADVKDENGKPFTRIVGDGWGAKVGGTMSETVGEDGKPRNVFSANPLGDFSTVKVGLNGYTTMGKTYSSGVSFETRDMGKGDFKVNFTKGAYFWDNTTGTVGKPETRVYLKTDTGGTLSYRNGQIVEKAAVGERDGGILRTTSKDPALATTGTFYGTGVVKSDLGPGFTARPEESQPVTIKITNGEVVIGGGERFENNTGETKILKGPDGRDFKVPVGTSFSYVGLDMYASRAIRDVKGDAITSVVEERSLDKSELPAELKGRGDLAALDPKTKTVITYSEGDTRTVERETSVVKGGTRQKLGDTITTELETVNATSRPGRSGRSGEPAAGADVVYATQSDKGWSFTRTNIWGQRGYSTDFELKGVKYNVKYEPYTEGGKTKERFTLNVYQDSLASKVGGDATIITNSGATYTGPVTKAVDGSGKEIPGLFRVAVGGTTWVGAGAGELKRESVFINARYDSSTVTFTGYTVKGEGGSGSFIKNEQTGAVTFYSGLKGGSLDLAVEGNTIQVRTDATGKQKITTDIKAPDGSAAIVITTARDAASETAVDEYRPSAGVHFGTVKTLPANAKVSLTSIAGGNVFRQELTLGAQKVLQQNLTNADGKELTTFLIAQDIKLPNCTISSDSRLRDLSGTLSLVKGHISTDGGPGQRLVVGQRWNDEDVLRVAGGASGGSASGPSERVVFHYEKTGKFDDAQIVMTRGEVFIRSGMAVFKPGTVFINSELNTAKNYNHPDRIRQLQSDGAMARVKVTYKDKNDDRAADIRDSAKEMKLDFDKWKGGGDGKKAVSLIVMDGGFNTIGSFNTTLKKEGVLWSDGTAHLDRGEIRLKSQTLKDDVKMDSRGNEIGRTTYFDAYRDGKDSTVVKGRGQTRTGNAFEGEVVRQKDGTTYLFDKGGKVTKTDIDYADGNNFHDGNFTGVGRQLVNGKFQETGTVVSYELPPSHYNYFLTGKGAGNLSADQKKQAKENYESAAADLDKILDGNTPHTGTNSLQFLVVAKPISMFANYTRTDGKVGGLKDMVHTVLLADAAWADTINGWMGKQSDFVGERFRGEKDTHILWGLGQLTGLKVNMKSETLKEMDKWGTELDSLTSGKTTLDQAKGNWENRNSWGGNFLGKLDKGAGWLLGFDRILALDTSGIGRAQGGWETTKETAKFLFHFGTCVAEQTLNFFSFGGGALLSTGAKGTATAVKVIQATEATAVAINTTQKVTLGAKLLQGTVSAGAKLYELGSMTIGKLLFNPVTTTGLTLYMRAKAADAVHTAIESNFEDPGSRKALGDTLTAIKDVALSEFAWIVPAIGALTGSGKVAAAARFVTGFGAKTAAPLRQTLFVGAVGAGAGTLDHYVNNRPGSVWQSAASGAVSAMISYGVFRALGGAVPGIGLTRGAEGATLAKTAAESGGLMSGALAFGRAFVTGGVANLVHKIGTGNLNASNISWSTVKDAVFQGGFLGVLGFGGLKAISNWNNVALKVGEGKQIRELLLAGNQQRFAKGALEAGVGIFTFEAVFNSVQWNGDLGFSGGHGLLNPLVWASALTKGLNATGILGKGHAEKAYEPGEGIFTLSNAERSFEGAKGVATEIHFMAMLGRLGTGLASGNIAGAVGQLAGNLANRATANYAKAIAADGLGKVWFLAKGALQDGTATMLNKFVVMPATMFQFEAYQKIGVNAAQAVGLIENTRDDGSGTLFKTNEKGEYIIDDKTKQRVKASDDTVVATKIISSIAFIVAPVGPAHSESVKEVNAYLEKAGPKLTDVFMVDGGASRRAPVLEVAAKLREAAPSAEAAGTGLAVKIGEHPVVLGANAVAEVSSNATRLISNDKAFRTAVADHPVGTVEAVIHDGATAKVIESKTAEGFDVALITAVGGETKASGTGTGESAAKVTGERTRAGDGAVFTAKVESTEGSDKGGSKPVTTDAKISVGANEVRVELSGTSKAAADPTSEVVVKVSIRGADGAEAVKELRSTAAEAKQGLKFELPKNASIDGVQLKVTELTDAAAAKVLTGSEPGATRPSAGLVEASQKKLGMTGNAFLIKVDAGLHTGGQQAFVAGLSDDELKAALIKSAKGEMPALVGAMVAGRIAERRFEGLPGTNLASQLVTGKNFGEALGSGKRAQTEFLSAADAGVTGETLLRVGLGTGVKTVDGERVLVSKSGEPMKLAEALTPTALARLPDAVRKLEGDSTGVRITLAPEGMKIAFEGVSQPAALFANGVPKNNATSGAPEATGPPAGAPTSTAAAPKDNPWVRVAKTDVLESGKPVDVSVVVGAKGAERFDVQQSGVKNGPVVSLLDGGVRYSNLNGTQTAKVLNLENTSPDATVENKMVVGQVNGGVLGKRTAEITVVEGGVVADATVGKFSLRANREAISLAKGEGANRPVNPKLVDAVEAVGVVPGTIGKVLDAGRRAETANPENGRSNFIADVVNAFRESKMTPDQKGVAARQLAAEAKANEKSASAALENAETNARTNPSATNVAARDAVAAKRSEAAERTKLAELIVREVDRRGCSACFVNYSDSKLIADVAVGALHEMTADIGFKGSVKAVEGFVEDRLAISAAESGDIASVPSRLLDAAELLKKAGRVKDARILTAVAETLKKSGTPESVAGPKGERIGKSEAEWRATSRAYNSRVVDLLTEGKTPSQLVSDRQLKKLGTTLIDLAGTKAEIAGMKKELASAEKAVRAASPENKAKMLQAIENLKGTLAGLESQRASGDVTVIEAVAKLRPVGEAIQVQAGAKQLDAGRVAEMRGEIEKMPEGPAKVAMSKVFEATENHVKNYNKMSPKELKESLMAIDKAFNEVRAAFPKSAQLTRLEPLFRKGAEVTEDTRNAVIADLFGKGKTEADLNPAERLAFVLTVSQAFFATDRVSDVSGALAKAETKSLAKMAEDFPNVAKLTALEPLVGDAPASQATRNAVVAELFGRGKTEANLTPRERAAFELAISRAKDAVEGKTDVKDALGKAETEVVTLRDKALSEGTPEVREANKKKDSFDNGKRAALLVQFMLGRTAGLEAGGGKTAIFPQAIAEFAMRMKRQGNNTPFVAELVVFNNAEVGQYIGRYQPLFKALGLEAVDGRISPSDTKGAIAAYTAKEGVTKVVVTDMNTRGFRQNDLEKAPTSELAILIAKNGLLKAADEVDAQVLSRMAFINSDGNLVAKGETVEYTKGIAASVYEALGVKPGEYAGADAVGEKGKEGKSPGYKDFAGGEVMDLKKDGVWYSKVGESVFISDTMMKKVQANLEARGMKDVTTGEIVEFVRALASVRNPTIFGFSREMKDGKAGTEDTSYRPTHKKDGMFQLGQIDSSPIFNVAAVLIERSYRAKFENASPERLDAELGLGDIRLSKASASATLIQALQGGGKIHRFAATGTPEALEGIIQATLGLELTQVYSSSRHDFTVLGNKTVKDAFANRTGTDMTVDYVVTDAKNSKAKLGADAIMEAFNRGVDPAKPGDVSNRGDAILIGARDEADLKSTLLAHLERAGGSPELIKHLADVKGGIRDVVFEAKKVLLTSENAEFAGLRTNEVLVEHVKRLDVCDGNGGKRDSNGYLVKWPGGEGQMASGDVAEATSAGRKIVYSTEEGLRGRNFGSKEGQTTVHAVFMGLELMSSEGRLQAWKRVDRDKNAAVRVEIIDKAVVQKRVDTAKRIDESLKSKFGRPEGLFAADDMLATALKGDTKTMGEKDLVDISGALSSLENLGQSAMFFINEQVESKLLKEPLAAWKARETSDAGKEFFAELQVDVLEHSDKKNIEQGTEYADPRKQALNAFNAGAERTIGYLTRVANNKNVSYEIRVEAASRIADLLTAQQGLSAKLENVNLKTGKHDAVEFQEAAFVNVSADVRSRPAEQVANAVVRLSDLLLPNTRTSVDTAGAKGGSSTVNVTASAASEINANRAASAAVLKTADAAELKKNGVPAENDAALLNGLPTSKGDRSGGKNVTLSGAEATTPVTVSYRQQALVVAYQTFDGMSDDDKARALPALVAAGLISEESESRDVPAGTSKEDKARILAVRYAVELVNNLGAAGMPADRVDVGRVVQAAVDLGALAPNGRKPTPSEVVFVALADDQREGTADVLGRMPKPETAPGSYDAPDTGPQNAAKTVTAAFESDRNNKAVVANKPEAGDTWGVVKFGFNKVVKGVTALFVTSPESAFGKLNKTTLATAANLPSDPSAKVDPKALAARLGAMLTLTTGLTGEARDKARTALTTLAEMTAADPAGMTPALKRITFKDVVALSREEDPVVSLRGLIEKKDVPPGPFGYILPAPVMSGLRGVSMVGSALLTFAGSMISPLSAVAVAATVTLTAAVGADATKKDPMSEMMTGMMKKVPGVGALMDKVPAAALPLVPAAIMGVVALLGGPIWPAVAAGALALGGLMGKLDLTKAPLGIGTLWGKITGVPEGMKNPAAKAVGALKAAEADITKEKNELFAKDDVLQALRKELKGAPAAGKSEIQQKIDAREAKLLAESPVEGMTLRRLIEKIKETVPEDKQADVLKKALLLHSGAEDGRAARVDEIVEKFKDTKNHAKEGGLFEIHNLDLGEVLDPETELDVVAAIGRFSKGNSGGTITVGGIDDAFGEDKVKVKTDDGSGTRSVTPNEVIRFFGGEDLTDDEIGALRSVSTSESNLKTALGVVTPAAAAASTTDSRTPAQNDVAALTAALRNNGLQNRAADIVEAARPGQPIAQAAKDVANEKEATLRMVGTILRMSGVSADQIRDFTLTVLQSPAVSKAVDAQLQAIAPKNEKKDIQIFGNVEPYALVSGLLANRYFDATGLGQAAIQHAGPTAARADVLILSRVASPEINEAGVEMERNWPTVVPMLQALTVAGDKGGVKLVVSGDTAKIVQVDRMGATTPIGDLTKTAAGVRMKISYEAKTESGAAVNVGGTIDVELLAGKAGLVVNARPNAGGRTETRVSSNAPWEPLAGTAVQAGRQFRFVPLAAPGEKVSEGTLRVFNAAEAPAASPKPVDTTKDDEDKVAPVPVAPKAAVPVMVGGFQQSLLPGAPGSAPADPQQVMFRAGQLFNGPVPVAPAGTKPNLAVVRGRDGAVTAVFTFNGADGKWHGVESKSGGPAARVVSDTPPAAAKAFHVDGDAIAEIASAKTPVVAEGRGILGRIADIFRVRVAAPAALFFALMIGGGVAKADTPAVMPIQGPAPIVNVQNAPLSNALRETDPTKEAVGPAATVATEEKANLRQPVAIAAPSADGATQTIVFDQPELVLAAAASVMPSGEGEKMVALPVTHGDNGDLHVAGAAREISSVHFEGAPVGGTPVLEALATELVAVPAKNPLTEGTDPAAVKNFDRLAAPASPFAGWMNSMLVGEVLEKAATKPKGADIESRFGGELKQLRDAAGPGGLKSVTFATAVKILGENHEFITFIKQLSEDAAETVSAPGVLYYPAATHLQVSQETGGAILMHGHTGQIGGSAADRAEAGHIADLETAEGIHGSGGTMLVAYQSSDGKAGVTTLSADMLGKDGLSDDGKTTVSPQQEQFQSLQMVHGMLASDMPLFFRLLPQSIQTFLLDHGIVKVGGLRAFDLQNPGDRAAAEHILDMQSTLIESKADAGMIRSIYAMAYKKANDILPADEETNFLRENKDSGIPLEALISGLSGQMRTSPGLQGVGAAGQLMAMQRRVEGLVMMHRFGAVSAMPAQDRGWYVNEMGSIRLNLISPEKAAANVKEITDKFKTDKTLLPTMIKQLMRITGAGTAAFRERLIKSMPHAEGMDFAYDVEPIITGKAPQSTPEKTRELQAHALALLLEPMAQALGKTMGFSMENERLRAALGDVKVSVIDANANNDILAGGLAVFDETSNTFYISIPAGMKQEEALCRMVALLAHEVTHLFVDSMGHELDKSGREKPTIVEEAEIQTMAGQLLMNLNLPEAKMMGDLLTFERIAKMADAQAVFLVYDDQVKGRADELKKIVRESQGLNGVVVIVTSEMEARAAAKVFLRSGVRLVRLSALADVVPMKKQSRVETYGYLNLGTRRIRIALPDSLLKLVAAAVADPSSMAALIRLVVTPEGATGPALELLMPVRTFATMFEKEILARTVAKQA